MRPKYVTASLLISGVVLAVAACGGGGGGNGGQPGTSAGGNSSAASSPAAAGINTSLDPCSLLTTAEVSSAVSMKVDDPKPASSEPKGTRGCTWNTAAGDSGAGAAQIASVTLEVVGPPTVLKSRFPTARSYYDYLDQHLYHGTDVPGIGDNAFLTSSDHWIFSVKGNVLLRVFATFGTTSTDKTVIEELMKDAMARV